MKFAFANQFLNYKKESFKSVIMIVLLFQMMGINKVRAEVSAESQKNLENLFCVSLFVNFVNLVYESSDKFVTPVFSESKDLKLQSLYKNITLKAPAEKGETFSPELINNISESVTIISEKFSSEWKQCIQLSIEAYKVCGGNLIDSDCESKIVKNPMTLNLIEKLKDSLSNSMFLPLSQDNNKINTESNFNSDSIKQNEVSAKQITNSFVDFVGRNPYLYSGVLIGLTLIVLIGFYIIRRR